MTSEETNRINRDLHRLKLYEKDLQKWYGIDRLTSATEKDSKKHWRYDACFAQFLSVRPSLGFRPGAA
jgi:hypothetical protein